MVVSTMARLWNGFIYDKAVASQKVFEKLNSVTSKFKKTEVKEINNEYTNKETADTNDKTKEAVSDENKETSKEDAHLGPDFSFNKNDDVIDVEAHEVTEEKLNEALNKEKRRDGHKNSDPNKKETGYRSDKKK